MNSALLLISIGLTALAGTICTLLYSKMYHLSNTLKEQYGQISQLDSVLRDVVAMQTSTQTCVSELSTEMQLRGVYQNANDRHKLAIKAAKNGKNRVELMSQHGLSSDEASLIISLHGKNIARGVHRNTDDKHKLAIKAAKMGKNRMELIRMYSLSNDEASLIISLHGGKIDYDLSSALVKPQPSFKKEAELTEA
jgi:hypothetical protein